MSRRTTPAPATAKEAVLRLGQAFDGADPALAAGAVLFPYQHAVDFRGKTSVHVYDQSRFAEEVGERPGGKRARRARTDLTVEVLSPTAALVREDIEFTSPDGDTGAQRALHTVVRSGTGWAVAASWYSEAPEWLVS